MNQSSDFDTMTGVYSRNFFSQEIDRQWQDHIIKQQPLSLVLADIDYCQFYNYHYGYDRADVVIQKIAKTIEHSLTIPHSFVTRFGGDEFLITLPNTNQDQAITIVKQIQKTIEQKAIPQDKSGIVNTTKIIAKPQSWQNISDRITLSYGIASIVPKVDQPWHLLLKIADEAVFEAKLAGRNCYCILSDKKIAEIKKNHVN